MGCGASARRASLPPRARCAKSSVLSLGWGGDGGGALSIDTDLSGANRVCFRCGAGAAGRSRARYHGGARARLCIVSWRRGRGHQRRIFPAAGGKARRLSLQPAGRVQGCAPQISADELSAGIFARRLSETDRRTFRVAAAAVSRARDPRRQQRNPGEGRSPGHPWRSATRRPALLRAATVRRSPAWSPAFPVCWVCARAMSVRSSGAWRYGTRTAASPDCMQIVAGLLTEDDVKAVAAWLSSRPAPVGSVVRAARKPADAACRAAANRTEGIVPMPRTLKDLFLVVVGACLSIGASPIAAHAQPATPPDNAAILAKGEYLARAGDCIACHTAREGKTFAGGLAMKTPFGTLYTSNITPDPQTGIGTWTADQFYTMMHNGRFPGWRLGLPGDAVCLLHQGDARRQRRDLRLSAFDPAGETGEPPARSAISLQQSLFDHRMAHAVLQGRRVQARSDQVGGLESRRLSGRRPRPLRHVPHRHQCARRQFGIRRPSRAG